MTEVASKEHYHHGDLKESLISATIELIRTQGIDRFSMTTACKEAGVSKAAPYRHFENKEALLEAVIDHGFKLLRDDMTEATSTHKPGTFARITALGIAYVRFAIKEPELFRLMFGDYVHPINDCNEPVGKPTFQLLVDEIISLTKLSDVDALMGVAFPLWTMVHGAATLTIDNTYDRIYPDNDTEQMITEMTTKLLSGYPEAD